METFTSSTSKSHVVPSSDSTVAGSIGVSWTLNSIVEALPVGALKTRPNNARTHSKLQIRQIADSIRAFGFISPILIDSTHTVIAGHGRLAAAQLLGLTLVPTLRLDHLTPDQIRAYVIADNKLAENAGWDREILSIELQHLTSLDSDLDVTITGFSVTEVDLILQESADDAAKPETVDLGPPLPAVSRVGDLWQLGRHRILCGDALLRSSYETLMGTDRAHMVITDAPFNVKICGHVSGNGQIKHREFVQGSGELSEEQFTDFLNTVCTHLVAYSHSGSLHFLFMDFRHLSELLAAALPVYHELKNLCVWVKDNAGMGSLYRSQHELVLLFKNGTAPHRNNVQLGKFGRHRSNVWHYAGVNTFGRKTDEGHLSALHPTVKPVAMIADAILDCSARGDIVLDSFLGSGSTLIAAERTGRICYAMELDPLYVDVAIRRWQRHTGDHAVHAITGRRFDDVASELETTHV